MRSGTRMSLSDRFWHRALLGDVRSRPKAAIQTQRLISYAHPSNSPTNTNTPPFRVRWRSIRSFVRCA
jgi:hypothetical protein